MFKLEFIRFYRVLKLKDNERAFGTKIVKILFNVIHLIFKIYFNIKVDKCTESET